MSCRVPVLVEVRVLVMIFVINMGMVLMVMVMVTDSLLPGSGVHRYVSPQNIRGGPYPKIAETSGKMLFK